MRIITQLSLFGDAHNENFGTYIQKGALRLLIYLMSVLKEMSVGIMWYQ